MNRLLIKLFTCLIYFFSISVYSASYQTKTPANDDGGGNLIYLDRHLVNCLTYAISSLHLYRPSLQEIAYEYKCVNAGNTSTFEKFTAANDDGGGNLTYLDRHEVDCVGKGLQFIHLERPSQSTIRYNYKCGERLLSALKDYYTPTNDAGGGNSIYLDRHAISCPDREVLSYLRLERPTSNTIRYHYKCGIYQEAQKIRAAWNPAVCLDVNGWNQSISGTQVQIWNCDEVSETWYFGEDKKIHAGWNPSVCLDVDGWNQTANGIKVQIWNCNEVSETWYMGDDKKIHAGWSSSVCLDVVGWNQTTNGVRVQIWNCNEVSETFIIGDMVPPTWLASLAAKRSRITQFPNGAYLLELFDPNQTVSFFTDRPYRRSERRSMQELSDNWVALTDNLGPNASITVGDNIINVDAKTYQFFYNPAYNTGYLSFQPLNGGQLPLGEYKDAHVFIGKIDNFARVFNVSGLIPDSNPHNLNSKTDDTTNLLFSLTSEKASINLDAERNRYYLTLDEVNPVTHAFQEHPSRHAKVIKTELFMSGSFWNDAFGTSRPNAIISGRTANGEIKDFVVTLSAPNYNIGMNHIAFEITPLDANIQVGQLTIVSIYIDSLWSSLKNLAVKTLGAVVLGGCVAGDYALISATVKACSFAPALCVPPLGLELYGGYLCVKEALKIFDINYNEPSTPPPSPSTVLTSQFVGAPPEFENRTFKYSTNNHLDSDWLLTTPSGVWGQTYANFPQAVKCTSGINCNTQFGLKMCSADSDCVPVTGKGQCRTVEATVVQPGQAAQKLCIGHSDYIIDKYYNTIKNARKFIDISHLGSIPEGRWLSAIQNGIAYASWTTPQPIIRYFIGITPNESKKSSSSCVLDAAGEMSKLLLRVPADKRGTLKVFTASGLPNYWLHFSWNHSKILAVDGKDLITGGHNFLSDKYLDEYPVFDVSMKITGDAAITAHTFINELWNNMWSSYIETDTYRYSSHTFLNCSYQVASHRATALPAFEQPTSFNTELHKVAYTSPSETPVMAAGNLAVINSSGQQLEQFIHQLIDTSNNSIYISQQDLGPYQYDTVRNILGDDAPRPFTYGWPKETFIKLGKAMMRGVNVNITLSDPNAPDGYAYNHPLSLVKWKIFNTMWKEGLINWNDGRSLLCNRLTLQSIRYNSGESKYPGPDKNIPNHAKTMLVDNKRFLIASHNLYNHELQEFGLIVEDATKATEFWNYYWNPLTTNSRSSCISGANCTNTTVQDCINEIDPIRDEL